jgi:RNA polymerase sigma-70 factor (ECF subfamily)
MYRVAYRMIGDKEDVSDIIQEIFIDFFNKTSNGKIINYPKSWLFRATVNRCIDNQRSKKQFQNIESLAGYQCEPNVVSDFEIKDIMTLAFSKLKPQEKILATLYGEGLSYKDISEATGIKFSSVGKMVSRTLKKIEKELKNHRYELY